MKSKGQGGKKKEKNDQEYAKEELKLRDETLSRTAPDTDEDSKSVDTVWAPVEGRMKPIEKEARIKPPSGKDIDREALDLRDKTLQKTAPDTDPKKKRISQVYASGERKKR